MWLVSRPQEKRKLRVPILHQADSDLKWNYEKGLSAEKLKKCQQSDIKAEIQLEHAFKTTL